MTKKSSTPARSSPYQNPKKPAVKKPAIHQPSQKPSLPDRKGQDQRAFPVIRPEQPKPTNVNKPKPGK